jgi:hypothetical protein
MQKIKVHKEEQFSLYKYESSTKDMHVRHKILAVDNPLSYGKLCALFEGIDRLCGLMVRVPSYRFRGLGSIPGSTDFLISSGSGKGSTQPHEYN